jgi:hypothetical protein
MGFHVAGETALLRKMFPTFVTHVLLKRYNRNIRYVCVKSSILFYVCGQYFNRRENMLRHRALHQRPEVMKRPPSPGPSKSPPKQSRSHSPLQVFFCSDEVWSIKKSGVILAGVVVPQFSSFDISQNKTKRQVKGR